jgi:L,D-peptidoglycan transpeptidase YkuD (ErfK/YbiS/YcfS/YnhG family)
VAAAGVVALVAGLVTATGRPAGAADPPGQVITVSAVSGTATTATVQAYQLSASGAYQRVAGPIQAYVGAAGIGAAHEGSTRTPQGTWGLTQAFGIAANPGTALPYFKVDNLDWWDEDQSSAQYNQHVRCAPGSCPFKESLSEHLIDYTVQYQYAVFFNYNTNPVVPGAGSGFFLHVANGQPTAGCVAVPQANMVTLLRWLSPGQHPVIDIGLNLSAPVGSQSHGAVPPAQLPSRPPGLRPLG